VIIIIMTRRRVDIYTPYQITIQGFGIGPADLPGQYRLWLSMVGGLNFGD
jgi:hypothetical protein